MEMFPWSSVKQVLFISKMVGWSMGLIFDLCEGTYGRVGSGANQRTQTKDQREV